MEARFLAKVNKTDTCWLWTASLDTNGHGKMFWGSRPHRRLIGSHRISHLLYKGPIPDGLVVRHKCRHRHCVNPDHLETGTQQDNMDDRVRDATVPIGEAHHRNKHTDEFVLTCRCLALFYRPCEVAKMMNVDARVLHQWIHGITRSYAIR